MTRSRKPTQKGLVCPGCRRFMPIDEFVSGSYPKPDTPPDRVFRISHPPLAGAHSLCPGGHFVEIQDINRGDRIFP